MGTGGGFICTYGLSSHGQDKQYSDESYIHQGHSQQLASALNRGISFPSNDCSSLSLLILICIISSFSLDLFQCHLVYITVSVTVNWNGVTQAFLPLQVSQSVNPPHTHTHTLYSRLRNTQKAI